MDRSDETYYQAHKDDPDEWGEDKPSDDSGTVPRLASTVSVRLTVEQEGQIRDAARRRGQTLSAYLRDAALQRSREVAERSRSVPTATTGLTPATQMPPLSSSASRASEPQPQQTPEQDGYRVVNW
jgi:hypothetical protein